MSTTKFIGDVAAELQGIQKSGGHDKVPEGTFKQLDDEAQMAEYKETMSVSECASLLMELAR